MGTGKLNAGGIPVIHVHPIQGNRDKLQPRLTYITRVLLEEYLNVKQLKLTHTSANKNFSIRHSCIFPKEVFGDLSPCSCLFFIINLCMDNMEERNKVIVVHDLQIILTA